jgi:hypothetical protein
LMTESEEETVEEAEASLRKDRGGLHTFKVIQAAIDAQQSRSVVTSVGAPADYSFRQVRAVLALARDGGTAGASRVVQLPQGTRQGFLSALAEIIHTQAKSSGGGTIQSGAPLRYVYHGRFYDLRATSIQFKRRFDVNTSRNAGIVSAQFTAKSLNDGEEDRFALSYAIDGPLAEVPLTISYQPRWWMQVDLVLADDVSSPLMAALDR